MSLIQVMLNVADSIPVVGHIKGAIHYCRNDMESFNEAIKSTSRSVVVATVGIVGFEVCGPFGACAGGVVGGIVADILISIAYTKIHGECRLYGHYHALRKLFNWNMNGGEGFYWALTLVFDGLAGRSYAIMYKYFKNNNAQYHQYKSEIENVVEQGKITLKDGQTASQLAQQIQKAANELKKAVINADSSKLGKNIVGTMNLDVKPHSNAGYLFSLLEELKIEAFDGGTASIQQILKEKFSLSKSEISGLFEAMKSSHIILVDVPLGADVTSWYKVDEWVDSTVTKMIYNGKNPPTPKMPISIVSYNTIYAAVLRCQPCNEIVKMILMKDIVTNTAIQTAVDLIPCCVNTHKYISRPVTNKAITLTLQLGLELSRPIAVTLPTEPPSRSLIGTNARENQQHKQKQQQSSNQSSGLRGENSGLSQQELTQSGGQRGNEQPNRYERNKESNEERLIQVRRQRAMLEKMLSMNGVEDARSLLQEITEYARELDDIVHSSLHFPNLQYLTQREREETEGQYNHNVYVAETLGWPRPPMPEILRARSQGDEFCRNNNVICVIQDTDGQDHRGYSLRLARALIETRRQDIRYMLESQFPNIRPTRDRQYFRYFEGWRTNEDTPENELTRCAEHMAYELLQYRQRVPRYTYSIMNRDGRVIFREPCPNCRQYPERQVFGLTVTQNMDGMEIPLDYDDEFDGQSQ